MVNVELEAGMEAGSSDILHAYLQNPNCLVVAALNLFFQSLM